jgi:hypothetical protein
MAARPPASSPFSLFCDTIGAGRDLRGLLQDHLTRAQHYRELAVQMRNSARDENDVVRRNELFDLARQYDRLVESLLAKPGIAKPT